MNVVSRKSWNLRRFDVRGFSEAGEALNGSHSLGEFERLAAECHAASPADAMVDWSVQGEMRLDASGAPAVWLQLRARLDLPVTCQRCLGPVSVVLEVDRWFRFVADEAMAEAQDDDSEEDVLAMEPKPDLLSLIEDELLMVIPMVPMHGVCPQPLGHVLASEAEPAPAPERSHPFAALAQLKK